MSEFSSATLMQSVQLMEREASSWAEDTQGYNHLRELAEEAESALSEERIYYACLWKHIVDNQPSINYLESQSRNFQLGIRLLTNFACLSAMKYGREEDKPEVGGLVELLKKEETMKTISEPAFYTDTDIGSGRKVSSTALSLEETMGIMWDSDPIETEIALAKYSITEGGITFDFPQYSSMRKDKSQCPANKLFGQVFEPIINICAKDPLLFERTFQQNQRTGLIIPVSY